MRAVRTIVLRHEQRGGGHYDWMIDDPTLPPGHAAGLTTWRLTLHPARWAAARRLPLTPLPPHRRAYLRREGWVSGGRGWVRRVDRGTAVIRSWTPDRAILDLHLRFFTGRLHLQRHGPHHWLGVAESPVKRP